MDAGYLLVMTIGMYAVVYLIATVMAMTTNRRGGDDNDNY